MSPDDLQITNEGAFVRLIYGGQFSVRSGQEVVDAMVEACANFGVPRALLDCRPMRGEMTVSDRFQVVEYAMKTRGVVERTVIVARPDQIMSDEFVENVAANRGIDLKVFDNPQEAERWLKQSPSAGSSG